MTFDLEIRWNLQVNVKIGDRIQEDKKTKFPLKTLKIIRISNLKRIIGEEIKIITRNCNFDPN